MCSRRYPIGSFPNFESAGLYEQSLIVLSHRFKVNGNAGDANAFAERLFGVTSTSRSWNTVQGLVRKFSVSPTTKSNG
jgi:hypothetical protein